MISVWLLIPVFIAGAFFGIFILCLAQASSNIDLGDDADNDVSDVLERSKNNGYNQKDREEGNDKEN